MLHMLGAQKSFSDFFESQRYPYRLRCDVLSLRNTLRILNLWTDVKPFGFDGDLVNNMLVWHWLFRSLPTNT